jgi:protease-4
MRVIYVVVVAVALSFLIGCSPKVQIDIGGASEGKLVPSTVFADPNSGTDRVAMIDVRGLLIDAARPSLLGEGENPVDRFVSQLDMAEKDASVKALIIRIDSPGGTVTASDMLHKELRRFEEVTHKPVIACLGEIAASGGYYLAIAADRIYAEPTTITGSIGVIMPTVNLSEGLAKIGIHSRAVKSGPNKDLANPLEPMRAEQYAVLQGLVDEFYARFKGLVIERRPSIKLENISMVTDGRVFTGATAAELGLVDEVGGVREAFAGAKKMAGLKGATLVKYTDEDNPARSAYTVAPIAPAAAQSGVSVQLSLPAPMSGLAAETSGVYYLWMPPSS